jgi:WD40 repeat protein
MKTCAFFATVSFALGLWQWTLAAAEELAPVRIFSGHRGMTRVAFAPDNVALLSTSDDKTARWWDVRTGETTRVIRSDEGIPSAPFRPMGAARKVFTQVSLSTMANVGSFAFPTDIVSKSFTRNAARFSLTSFGNSFGKNDTTRSSTRSFPSATAKPIAVDVKLLLIEYMV